VEYRAQIYDQLYPYIEWVDFSNFFVGFFLSTPFQNGLFILSINIAFSFFGFELKGSLFSFTK
jgi:hypothetical protein